MRFFLLINFVTTLLVSLQPSYGINEEENKPSRKLTPWTPYLTVPGQTGITLCTGESVEVSMCPTVNSSDSNVNCFGNPFLELGYPTPETIIASNVNYCGTCPSLFYTFEGFESNCETFYINAGCLTEGECGGVAGIRITTTSCPMEHIGISPPGNYPILDCELVQEYRASICSLDGMWSILSAGNYRNPCSLDGDGYGCHYYPTWRQSSYYVCMHSAPTSYPAMSPSESPPPTLYPTPFAIDPTSYPTSHPTPYPTHYPTPFPADFRAFTRVPEDPLAFTFEVNLSANQSICTGPFSISGELNTLFVGLAFPGSRTNSWAADMALGFYRDNFPPFQIGGYDLTFPGIVFGPQKVVWPDNWKFDKPEDYFAMIDLSVNNWRDTGDYRFCIMNGWSESNNIFYSGFMTFSYAPSTKYGFGVIFGDMVGGIHENGILVDFIRDTSKLVDVIRPVTYVGNINEIAPLWTGNHSSGSSLIAWRSVSMQQMSYGPWMCSALIESGTLQFWLVSFGTEEVVGFILQDYEEDSLVYRIYFFGNPTSRRLSMRSSSTSSPFPVPISSTPPSFTRSLSTECEMAIVGTATVSNLRKFKAGISDHYLYLLAVPSLSS